MATTKIEWTETTWNPTTGCTHKSAGCQNCYAEIMARRLNAMGVEKYKNGFELAMHPETLMDPYRWKKPRMIFVNSMSDLFHEKMPLEYIQKVFDVMNNNPKHIFQVLTKRAEILEKYSNKLNWTGNIWMGVTVESDEYAGRVNLLRNSDAMVKFISIEPMIGPINNIDLSNIDWVIVGGESGQRPRPMQREWVENIYYECEKSNTAFFFKQWGGRNKKIAGRELFGRTFDEMPEITQAHQLKYA